MTTNCSFLLKVKSAVVRVFKPEDEHC